MSSYHPDDTEESDKAPGLSGDAAPPWIAPLLHQNIR